MSAITGITPTPVFFTISLAVDSRALWSLPFSTKDTPASANAIAHALPNPRLDAHTIAVRPFIPRSINYS